MATAAQSGFRSGIFAGLCMSAVPISALAEQPCFSAADNARLSFEVIQQAPPPQARAGQEQAQSYSYYPLTGAASMQLGKLAAAPSGIATYYFQWANRSNAVLTNRAGKVVPRKPNFQPSVAGARQQRTRFSSMERANACTLAQTAAVLGKNKLAGAMARKAQISLVSETQQQDLPPQGPPDICIIPAGKLTSPKAGVLLDYEAQDGRSAAQTLTFLQSYAALVRQAGRPVLLLLDPLDAPSQRYNGISADNIHAIVDLFDRTTIMLWSRNAQGNIAASYASQKAMIEKGGAFDGSRLLINFELAGTNAEDATFVRHTILKDRLAGVLFWRNHARQGGNCETDVNRKIAAIAFVTPNTVKH